jgi:PKD repeat protein
MANQLNEFDKMIKESLDGYEAPYDHTHWEELEEELNVTAPGISTYFGAVTTGLVLTGIVFIGMLFFNSVYFNGSVADIQTEDEKTTGIGKVSENQTEANSVTTAFLDDSDSTDQAETQTVITEGETGTSENINTIEESEKMTSTNPENKGESLSMTQASSESPTEIETSESENSPKLRTGCTGMTIDFNASEEYGKDAHFLWNFGDGYFSNEANPSHTFNKEGIFDVSLSVTSPSSGQITSNVVQAMIEVVEAPIANLELDIESPEVVKLGNKSYNATEIQWKLDGEIVSAKPEINVSLADNTHYQLSLIAYNEGGCSDTLQAEVNSVIAGNEFPKAYETSYGTSFAPGAIIDDGNVTSIKIFEKASGNLVFEGSGSKGWEGTNLSGEDATPGKYQWVMMVNKSDAIDIYHGEIQLR